MKTAHALEQAKAEFYQHYDALYGEDYTRLTQLLDDLITAAQSSNPDTLDKARAEFHQHYDAFYGEDYTRLTELLDDLVTAARA
ncbi:hypothetical protein WKI65_44210 [Streptomyces sp. MS1.AVA.3]|uniref:hypothetical protein n=1 Tax=Streptomyces decoyicus TaxID=249567 RepID=UPI0030C25721